MIIEALKDIRDRLHAQVCYQLFITPLPIPIDEPYREFADWACELLSKERTNRIEIHTPRHHIIHHFAQPDNPAAPKVLITHGWMSRAAYMIKLIQALHNDGYEVFAMDFPAHGEAKGLQLTWMDAVLLLKETMDTLGPFYAVIGHSFGGAMLLNTMNLAAQLPQWEIKQEPERMVLIAAPTNMRVPVRRLAKAVRLSGKGYRTLRQVFRQKAIADIEHLNYRHFAKRGKIRVLCIHGKDDTFIHPSQSIQLCQRYPHASLTIIPDTNHVDILINDRMKHAVRTFLN